ncbi:MAG: class II aldolase/adducin family protein [Lachnospiraceae bacterium]|nr:class II aldolase/adducin family protein [Lachnospiraceae bacterium]
MTEREAKESVVKAGVRLVESGLIARTWGNVSCKINKEYFVITPSGRDYLSLTPDEIVTVAISDCSYTGDIKPSGEKRVHAEVYRQNPNINFVIHTHQENASVVSALGLDSIKSDLKLPLLGQKIICASYGLPGTKKLQKGVSEALKCSEGNAMIMKNHGAVCFGKDAEEAFAIASDLEKVCESFIESQYKKIAHVDKFDAGKMRSFALSKITKESKNAKMKSVLTYCNSERTPDGFNLIKENGSIINLKFAQLDGSYDKEARIHKDIYLANKSIHHIIHKDTPDILTVSHANVTLYPLVDDFAQIVGTKVKTVSDDPFSIAKALKKASAVLVSNNSAYCCGASEGDACAVHMIMEKNCKTLLCGTLFPKIKPISWLDRNLMRFVYLKKYSKQIENKK